VELPRIPPDLIARLRADPLRAPESIALAAGDIHGPAAASWERGLRSRYEMSDRDLARRAKARHAALARFEGAATGIGGLVTLIPDLVGLLWIQSRLVFYVAAAYGFDPTDGLRPAELLVLRDLYDDVPAARAALDGEGRHLAEAMLDKSLRGGRRDAALLANLLRFAGKRGAKSIAGRAIPGLAVVVNSVGNERDTRALADRAIRVYSALDAGP
jgi:transcriptional regulator with XRE-family HTH domain